MKLLFIKRPFTPLQITILSTLLAPVLGGVIVAIGLYGKKVPTKTTAFFFFMAAVSVIPLVTNIAEKIIANHHLEVGLFSLAMMLDTALPPIISYPFITVVVLFAEMLLTPLAALFFYLCLTWIMVRCYESVYDTTIASFFAKPRTDSTDERI